MRASAFGDSQQELNSDCLSPFLYVAEVKTILQQKTLLAVVVITRDHYFAMLMKAPRVVVLLKLGVLVALCTTSLLLTAQTDLGNVQGHVQDPQNKPVAGATVTLRNPSTAYNRSIHRLPGNKVASGRSYSAKTGTLFQRLRRRCFKRVCVSLQ